MIMHANTQRYISTQYTYKHTKTMNVNSLSNILLSVLTYTNMFSIPSKPDTHSYERSILLGVFQEFEIHMHVVAEAASVPKP